MVLGINGNQRLSELEEFLDEQQTAFTQKVYGKTGYPIGYEMREITEEESGQWELSSNAGMYDLLNLPYQEGILIIERPTMNHDNCSYRGHKVTYHGGQEITDTEIEKAKQYLAELHQREKQKSKEYFLESIESRAERRAKGGCHAGKPIDPRLSSLFD